MTSGLGLWTLQLSVHMTGTYGDPPNEIPNHAPSLYPNPNQTCASPQPHPYSTHTFLSLGTSTSQSLKHGLFEKLSTVEPDHSLDWSPTPRLNQYLLNILGPIPIQLLPLSSSHTSVLRVHK